MFEVGASVRRIEDQDVVAAVVVDVVTIEGCNIYLLDYVEGGQGWWPEESLEPA